MNYHSCDRLARIIRDNPFASAKICGFFRPNLACFDLVSLFRPSNGISRQPISR